MLTDVIATHSLDVLNEGGHVVDVWIVSIGLPQEEAEGHWSAKFTITPLRNRVYWANGIDAVQALEGVMLVAGCMLVAEKRPLRWKGSAHGGLFAPSAPLPSTPPFDVIAVRSIDMLDDQGQPREVFRHSWSYQSAKRTEEDPLRTFPRESTMALLSIGHPFPAGDLWGCPYRVRALDVEQDFSAWGFTGVHALRGALSAVSGGDATMAVSEALVNLSLLREEFSAAGLPVMRSPRSP